MELRIDNPQWLLLLIPVIFYFLFYGLRYFKAWHSMERLVFVLRIAAVLFLLFSLTGPYWYAETDEEQIIFLVDGSASVQSSRQEVVSSVAAAAETKRPEQLTGIFTFAGDFQTVQPISSELEFTGTEIPELDTGSTNISQALQLAAASSRPGVPMRIILISDGNETEGSVLDGFNLEGHEHLSVDVFPLGRQTAGGEVALDQFTAPADAVVGEELDFSFAVSSTGPAEAELVVTQQDKEIDRKQIILSEGRNEFSFSYPALTEGLLKFEAVITPAAGTDYFTENNRMISLTDVTGAPHILIVSGEGASPISGWLDQRALLLSEITASSLPSTLSSILEYDVIIFDNIPATSLTGQQMDVIEQGVRNFGIGFMMIGGDQSFGLGGYFKTPIEQLLPVDMEVKGKHQLPSLGLMIVMDRSGSMSGLKLELAKEAAARSVELLRPDDTLGVIAFDDRPWEIRALEKLENPEEAVNQILSITPGGGTEIYRPLAEAYSNLEDLELQRKHIILLTDGQSALPSGYADIIDEGLGQNVTLSTVAIGQDADRELLESMAEAGSGRYYDVADATTIPAILSRETAMLSRTYIVDEPFTPTLYDSYWNSVFAEGVPQMNAYIATTAKGTATIAAESDKEDPILAEWHYGLGRTIAYTSNSGAWSGEFLKWSGWNDFWNKTTARLLPSYKEIPFDIRREEEGVYTVEDPSGASALLDVEVANEAGQEIEVKTEPVAPGKVRLAFNAEPGLLYFAVSNERNEVFQQALTLPYEEEYQLLDINEEVLTAIAARTGGQVLDSLEDAFREMPAAGGVKQSAVSFFIFLAMLLFFLDITIRRFGSSLLQIRLPRKKEDESEQGASIDQLIKAKKSK